MCCNRAFYFVAQIDHQIAPSRAPRRDVAGGQDYSHQQCGYRQKDPWIFGAYAVERVRHEMRYKQSGEQTDGDT